VNVTPSGLAIDAALPALRTALQGASNVLLVAPPGAGKSTIVPLELLGESWAANRRLIMLEPRRLAARAVAERMAHLLGERVGHTVGYRMRLDTRISRHTRIEVLTEGVLTRMLQSDPALEGTAALIFDEFHERSLQGDLGLALALDAQATIAPTLKLLLMSATLDVQAVLHLLGGAPLVSAEGRAFPVETRYVGGGDPLLPGGGVRDARRGREDAPERATTRIVQRALRDYRGDVLVFLPGAAEIRRVGALLAQAPDLDAAIRVLPLFGELAQVDQDAALAPDPDGRRKVVLATNIAETSLTIEGIRIVVDCGLVRRPSFDPVTGMSGLTTRRISRASAAQRQGRAGRTAPGVCYRLWSEEAHRRLAAHSAPEILEADLAPLALELALWGAREMAELRWLDTPPPPMLTSARELLQRLGALDAKGRATAQARAMALLGVHPRLAHMLLKARELGRTDLAAKLAALLSERDVLLQDADRDADIRTRLELLDKATAGVRQGTVQRVRRAAAALARQLGSTQEASRGIPQQSTDAGILLAFAYPDRIGLRRPGAPARYLLTNGRGAFFSEAQVLSRRELIVAVDLDDRDREARILLAAPLERSQLLEHFSAQLERTQSVGWDEREQAVIARETVQLGAITLEERALNEVPAQAARAAMLDGVRRLGLDALPWNAEVRDLQARMQFVRRLFAAPTGDEAPAQARSAAQVEPGAPAWPDVSDAALEASLEQWLSPWLEGVLRREHLARIPLREALHALLGYQQQRQLEQWAPTHLTVPSGSRVRIDYLDESAPAVSVRLQEVFGLQATPRIAGNRVPVTFKLLSPAHRPVQITRDLASFWRGAYAEVRKDLRGRYPRHYWPEDPLQARPTRRIRPRN